MAAKRVKKPQETTVVALKRKASEAYKVGDTDRAVALLFTAASLDLDDYEIASKLFSIAQNYFYKDQFDKALAIFLPLNMLDFDSFSEHNYSTFLTGMSLVRLGEKEQGEALMKKGIADDETNPWFTSALGFYLLNENRFEEGIQCLQENIEIKQEYGGDESETAAIVEAIAWAEFKLERQKEALEFILEQTRYFLYDSLYKLFVHFLRLADDQPFLEIAILILQEIIDRENEEDNPRNIDEVKDSVIHEFGKRLQRLRGNEEGKKYFETIIAIDPENIEAKLALGKVQLELGAFEEALELAQKATAIAPDDARTHALLAQVRLAQNSYQDALNTAETGLSILERMDVQMTGEEQALNGANPFTQPVIKELGAPGDEQIATQAELLLAKADALTNLKQLEAALETVKVAQRLYPSQMIFYTYAATLLLQMDKPRAAADQIAAARSKGLKMDTLAQKLNRKIKAALAKIGN